jgi:hypothetical protein
MRCPAEDGAPTLQGELRRGVNPYNLSFGAVAACALAGLAGVATSKGLLPQLTPGGAWAQAIWVGVGLFILLTFTHTLAHGAMGWLFERGLRAHCEGKWGSAVRLLSLAERQGMDHYDPHGVALAALHDSRKHL